MSNQIRIPLYIVLVLLAGISGYFALTNFGKMMDRAADRTSALEQIEPETKPPFEEVAPETIATTNPATAAGTNALDTNAVAAATNAVPPTTDTNIAATPAQSAPAEAEVPTALSGASKTKAGGKGGGRIGIWMGLFVVSLVCLGILIANDVSHFMGNRALKTLYNDEGAGQKDPEYDEAEAVWASGKHLEAIGLMRDYLKKNPREQHVAIRIAEIYEKDLGNHLAAALEYEEVLKNKLPADRWGWAAIHLCNLYFKLNQEQKGYELLRRLVKEHPETPAGDKARKRLEQVGGELIELPTESNVRTSAPSAPARPEEPTSNLPPGFRPKK